MKARLMTGAAGGLLATIVVVATACTNKPSPANSESPTVHGSLPTSGCGGTALHSAAAPSWVPGPPKGLRYAEDPNGVVAAFLFRDPLTAGSPTNPSNKILWALRPSLTGSVVTLTVQPANPESHSPSFSPIIQQLSPVDPRWAYPSIVDVPVAGCWRFSFRWDKGEAILYLPYVS
jgi:hypothetical protein